VNTAATPICTSPAVAVSWDSAGPQGPQGPIGPASDQYDAQNAWAGSVQWPPACTSGCSGTLPPVPSGDRLTITNANYPFNASATGYACEITGSVGGSPVTYSMSYVQTPPSGLAWYVDGGSPINVACGGPYPLQITLTGFLTSLG
jgi:hypothetical protein